MPVRPVPWPQHHLNQSIVGSSSQYLSQSDATPAFQAAVHVYRLSHLATARNGTLPSASFLSNQTNSSATQDGEWVYFYNPEPDEKDPPTLDEIEILREFVESWGTPRAIQADTAARRLMCLCTENHQGENVDKGERVAWLLWDVGIEMPQYQPAILRLVEAIKALPTLDSTEEQIRTWRFKEKSERWRKMEAFDDI
ncbi:hypothetical protein CFD26_103305 [Aspergillus turcosus]|uniref:Uncharacterized protein n=1 Tax=Aspergillus turcosus TaxID=1245748 RepID=A0A3R7LX19_9EURO|nr:hypothetical protein CFD26_103305 [Aspergillus turcosus]